jgi:hypothetical protein
VAILIFILSVLVTIFNLVLYKRRGGYSQRWHFIFSAFASLFMGIQFLLAAFDVWGIDGKLNAIGGRIGVMGLLTALGLTSTILYKRE